MPQPRTMPSGLALVLALLASLLMAGCVADAPEPAPRPVLVVMPGAVGAGTVAFAGEVRPREETVLAFRVGGKLASRQVDVGDVVRRGALLAELEAAAGLDEHLHAALSRLRPQLAAGDYVVVARRAAAAPCRRPCGAAAAAFGARLRQRRRRWQLPISGCRHDGPVAATGRAAVQPGTRSRRTPAPGGTRRPPVPGRRARRWPRPQTRHDSGSITAFVSFGSQTPSASRIHESSLVRFARSRSIDSNGVRNG